MRGATRRGKREAGNLERMAQQRRGKLARFRVADLDLAGACPERDLPAVEVNSNCRDITRNAVESQDFFSRDNIPNRGGWPRSL